MVLRVLDATGNGVADVPIALAPAAGTVPDTAVTTDSLGEARVRWTLGRATGDQTLAARVEGIKRPLRLTAHALPGRAANVSFDDPSITPKVRGTQRVVAVVTDEFGNPVPDARVRLKTTSGRVSPERAVTDSRGRVAVTWTHGAAGGEQSVTARVGDSDVSGTFVAQLEEKAAPKAPVRTVSRKKSGKR